MTLIRTDRYDQRRVLILCVADSLRENRIGTLQALAALEYLNTMTPRGKVDLVFVEEANQGAEDMTPFKAKVVPEETTPAREKRVKIKMPYPKRKAERVKRTEDELAFRRLIGQSVVKARAEKNLTIQDLAFESGVRMSSVKAIETSDSINPRGELAHRVFTTCGIDFRNIESSFFNELARNS